MFELCVFIDEIVLLPRELDHLNYNVETKTTQKLLNKVTSNYELSHD